MSFAELADPRVSLDFSVTTLVGTFVTTLVAGNHSADLGRFLHTSRASLPTFPVVGRTLLE
jgi:hypothetical protein